jgi:hypothetical protein
MARFTRAQQHEVRAIEALVGPAGLRRLPFHTWHHNLVRAGGQPSPAFAAAAEHARHYYAALCSTSEEQRGSRTTSTFADRSGRPTSGIPGAASASRSSRIPRFTRSRQ